MVKFQVVRFTKYHTLFQIFLYPYLLLFSLQPTYDAPNTCSSSSSSSRHHTQS